MPDDFTPNLNLILPEIGASKDTWGGKLNDNFTALDGALNASGDAGGGGVFLPLTGGALTGPLTGGLDVDGGLTVTGGGLSADGDGSFTGDVLTSRVVFVGGGEISLNGPHMLITPPDDTGGRIFYGGNGGPDAASSSATIMSRKMADNRYVQPSTLGGYVPTSRSVSTGSGISGGGNLTANRTLSLDVGYVDTYWTRRTVTLTAGNGISGGGNLTANRTFSLDTGYVDNYWARKTVSISTGTGLNGGGSISANRTISLDTSYTDNRYLRPNDIEGAVAGISIGAVGSYAFLYSSHSSSSNYSDTRSAGGLQAATAGGATSGSAPSSGTWRCHGRTAGTAANEEARTTLWQRIS